MGENMTDLTKITTPFGLLDEVYGPGTKEALVAHGGPWELFDGVRWTSFTTPPPDAHPWSTYRVKPQSLTKPSIDWSDVAKEYKWLARDEDGSPWLYEEMPEPGAHIWRAACDCAGCKSYASYTPGTCDWRDSLVERPK